MDVQDLRKDIVRYLREEPSVQGEKQSVPDEKVREVAQTVFRKVVEGVLPEEERPKYISIIATATSDVQRRIFDACVGVRKGGSLETVFLEAALACAEKDPKITVEDLSRIGPEREEDRVELAKRIAQSGSFFEQEKFSLLERLKIEKESARIEITKVLFENIWESSRKYFQQAFLQSLEAIVKISFFTKKYIDSQNGRAAIAKLCAQRVVWATAEYFGNFGITDQKARIEIAAYFLAHSSKVFEDKEGRLAALPEGLLPYSEGLRPYSKELTESYNRAFEVFQNPSPDSFGSKLRAQKGFDKDVAVAGNRDLLLSIIFFCYALKRETSLESPDVQEAVLSILRFRDPSLKRVIRDSLLKLVAGGRVADFEKFVAGKIPGHAQSKTMAYVFLTAMFEMTNIDPGLKEQVVSDFLKRLEDKDFFLFTPRAAALIEFMGTLNDTVADPEKQQRLYNEFASSKEKKTFSERMFLFRAAIAFKVNVADLTYEQIQREVKQRLPFPEGWIQVFESLRRPESLFVYASKIQLLGDAEKRKVLETLQNLMKDVVDKKFVENRYAQSPQLNEMKQRYLQCPGHTERDWDELIRKWRSGGPIELNPVVTEHEQAFDAKAFFRTKMGDGHFPTEKMPLLCAVLADVGSIEGKPLKERISEVLKEEKGARTERRFDALCAQLALAPPATLASIKTKVHAVLQAVPQWELRNDLEGLITQAEASARPDSPEGSVRHTAENTDDFWDLFLCGTEVAGSCQRVDGTPELNKNLLGYVVDGKCRMIAIKEGGRIAARSIIKLLWDDAAKKPVLLAERVYANDWSLVPIVEAAAKAEAARLGLELVTLETAQGRKFLSFPNRSGFEYEDAADIVESVPLA